MCGITGVLLDPSDPSPRSAALDRMIASITHRGPDAAGRWTAEGIALGHRRLSIIDLEGGAQPMQLPGDGPVIVYNGEVYNYASERETLVSAGHRFETDSDTEVVLRLFAEHGTDFTHRLRGMFALAIWDPAHQRLVLVRDRLGIKPLYWAQTRAGVVFGSELKAVMASGLVDDAVDPQAVDDFFTHGYVRAPRTIFAAVRKLAPGHLLTATRGAGLDIRQQRYWEIPRRDPGAGVVTYEEAKQRLTEVLDEAVRLRLRSDVPLGAFLSGGIDSSTVVWRMSAQVDRPIKTFSIGFDDAAVDESRHALAVAEHFGTDHHPERVTADSVALLPELMAAHDEPFGDPSSIPTWYVSRLARKHVTVCLSGDGGDELFAGYVRYPRIGRQLRRNARIPALMRRAIARSSRLFPTESRQRDLLGRVVLDPETYYSHYRSMFSEDMRTALYDEAFAAQVDMAATARVFGPAGAAIHTDDPVARVQAADLAWYLPDDILTKVDRMSMAHSLEARVPLLDHHFVELAASLPVEYKLRDGRTKAILRDIIEPHLPPRITARGKQGFSLPLRKWFAGPLGARLEDALTGPTYRESGWFRPDYLQRLWQLHCQGDRDLSWTLWQVLVFDVWYTSTRPTLGRAAA